MPLPRFAHMRLARLDAPFDHPDWLFEIKYDGFRALAYCEVGTVRLVSRRDNAYKSFGNLCAAMATALSVTDAVLDGEIVHFDSDGRPQFYHLLRRRQPQQFVAFDLLWLNGRDLRTLPLIERKRRLRKLIPRSGPLLYADHVERNSCALYAAACERDLEGVVAKRKDGPYTPEETSWVKIKNPNYSQAEGRQELFERRSHAGVIDQL